MSRLSNSLSLTGALVFWLAAGSAQAQLAVSIKMAHVSFVTQEPMKASLILRNDLNETFIIDDYDPYTKNEVRFRIWQTGEQPYPMRRQGRLVDQLMVMPGEVARVDVSLGSWYPLAEPGRYFIQAEVVWDGRSYLSPQVMFDVVNGIEMVKVVRPVPGYRDLQRSYRLLYWSREQREQLFLRVDDGEQDAATCVGFLALGQVVRFHKPTLSVQPDGQVVVVHQVGSGQFIQNVWMSDRNGLTHLQQRELNENASSPLIKALQEEARREAKDAKKKKKR